MDDYSDLKRRLRERAYALAAASPEMETEKLVTVRLLVEAANALDDLEHEVEAADGARTEAGYDF